MFYSVLFPTEESSLIPRAKEEPAFFGDLNLDQIMRPVIQAKPEFQLEEFFYSPLRDPAVIRYRHDVMRELEDPNKRMAFEGLIGQISFLRMMMDGMRAKMMTEGKFSANYLDMGRMMQMAFMYAGSIAGLAGAIRHMDIQSDGLKGFAAYLISYSESDAFRNLQEWAKRLRDNFDKVRYCLYLKNNLVRVMPYEGQENYADRIADLFSRFRQADAMDYRRKVKDDPVSEKVEIEILNMVATIYPAEFKDLTAFCKEFLHFDDDTIMRFVREYQFYACWLDYTEPLRQKGLPFCYPTIHEKLDDLKAEDCYDLALAARSEGKIVPNGFSLKAPEQILVVSGPNQGGKTTFARSFGQIHYLSSLGVRVQGCEADIFLCDQVLTHFEREEDLNAQSGKLQDDLVRLRAMLEAGTPRSVIVVNEIFASTTLVDALQLGRHMIDAFVKLGTPAVVVTFLEELADYGEQTVSMVSSVSDDEKHKRTYRIVRKEADGLAYALQIAARHGLTYEQLERRLQK